MNREEAERALGIIRQVVQDTREDLVAHNWGLIWMAHAFTNLASFNAIGFFVESRGLPIFWYLVPLAITGVLNMVIIAVLRERDQGVRSFVEWQVHGIWFTFMAFTVVAAAVLFLSDASPLLFCPLLGLTSGIGFSMMGVVFYRHFLVYAALFVAVTLIAPIVPTLQWPLLGIVWWVALFVSGFGMHREKRRRTRDGSTAQIL